MAAKLELASRRFGKLLVKREAVPSPLKGRAWVCVCDCGAEVVRRQIALTRGSTLSCGCNKKAPNAGHFKTTHGATPRGPDSPLKRAYRIWHSMKQRTTNPAAHAFGRYGGAGITMCPKWLCSFEAFLEDMGEPPSSKHTIDRVDGSRGYDKSNCRWATYAEQNRNRSNTVLVEFNGQTVPLADFAESAKANGISYRRFYMRVVKYGWSIGRAIVAHQKTDRKHG